MSEFVWMNCETAELYVLKGEEFPAVVLGKGRFEFLGYL